MKARLPKEFQSKSQAEILKQAQEMQQNITSLQEELDEREFEASADGDLVVAKVNGKHELLSLKISEELLKDVQEENDPEMLEDLIITAVNKAVKTATEVGDAEMDKLTGGLNIPGFPGF